MRIIGFVGLAVLVSIVFLNAIVMLVSPRMWFRLPFWVAAHGSLTEQKYATGWGAIQLRVAGALLIAGLGWAFYDAFVKA